MSYIFCHFLGRFKLEILALWHFESTSKEAQLFCEVQGNLNQKYDFYADKWSLLGSLS